jgi:hypothetical protein
MATRELSKSGPLVVICRWHPSPQDRESTRFIAVTICGLTDPQDAANNACLYLIWDRQGDAEACFVIQNTRNIYVADDGIFDVEEYDDYITFAGEIISSQELEPKIYLS